VQEEPQDRRRDPSRDDEDEAPRKKSRKAKSRRDDNPDRDDDERRGRRRKKKQKQSNTGLIVILSGAGALVLLLILVGGFVWPGFFKGGSSKARAAAPVDPFGFVCDNCEMVFGINLTQFRSKPGFQREFEKALRQSRQLSPAQFDFAKNLDRALVTVANTKGGHEFGRATVVVVLTSATPLDSQKVRQVFNAGPAQEVQGKTIFKINDPNLGARFLMSLPDDKTVVLGVVSETNFVRLLEGKSKLPPSIQSQANGMAGRLAWTVIDLQAVADQAKTVDLGLQMVPGGAQVASALKNAKTLSFFYDVSNEIRAQLDLNCANEADAEQVETFAKNLWEQQGKPHLAALPAMMGNQPGGEVFAKMFNEIGQSFQIERQGLRVSASITISENTVKELEQLQAQGGGDPFNPGFNPGAANPGVGNPNPGVANPGEANPGAVNPAPPPKRPNRPPPKRPPPKSKQT
jgi:hypothetical protein